MTADLRNINLFSQFSDREIAVLEKYFILREFRKGEVIINRDKVGKDFFVIVKGGAVSGLNRLGMNEGKHSEFSAGDFFGESSFFGNKPSFDSYHAAEDSIFLVIGEGDFLKMMEDESDIAVKLIYRILSLTIQRLKDTSKFLADVVQWGEEASRRVITDEMTGVYNRVFLEDALESFFNISKNNNKSLSLLIMDIDNFKDINSAGDEAGNGVITEFAEILKRLAGIHGIIARFGGDEFFVLLPDADIEKAHSLAEEIRAEVERNDFSKYLPGRNIPVTTSIGISSFPETAADLVSFREKADASLFRAKDMGRNRIECIR